MKYRALIVVVLLFLFVGLTEAYAAEARPRFTWNTFQFFWNKQALGGAEIKTAERNGDEYNVFFGSSTVLVVRMDEDIVREVEARFLYTGAPDVSGRAFLRLQDTIIRVGTFRWPDSMRERVEELFRDMTPQLRVHQARTSRFERRMQNEGIWTMTLRFVDES